MAQTVAQIEARLANVRAAIDRLLTDGVTSFQDEGGFQATNLDLGKLQEYEASLLRQLKGAKVGANRFQAGRVWS